MSQCALPLTRPNVSGEGKSGHPRVTDPPGIQRLPGRRPRPISIAPPLAGCVGQHDPRLLSQRGSKPPQRSCGKSSGCQFFMDLITIIGGLNCPPQGSQPQPVYPSQTKL